LALISGAVKNDQQALGKATLPHRLLYLQAVHGLGELHRNRGAYEVALPLLQEAHSICVDSMLMEEPLAGEVLTSLAAVELLKGDLQKSAELHNAALDVRTKCFGRNHPKVASTLTHLARLAILNCEFGAALKQLKECHTTYAAFYGSIAPTHPTISACTFLEARAHIALYELEPAQKLLQEVLSQRIQRFGDRHPAVAQCLCAMADVHYEQLRLNDAHQLYESVLLIRREAFGDHPHVSVTEAQVGTAMCAAKQSRFTDAMPIFEECIEARKAVLSAVGGRYHTDLATMTMHYGAVALTVGMVSDAATLIGQSGADQYSSFQSEQHLRVADALFHAANVSKAQGKYKDAKYQYSMCMSIKYRYLGRTHPAVLDILYESCDNMRCVGYFADATDAVLALEELTVERFGSDSLQEGIVQKLKAHIYCDKALHLKAEPLYRSALNTITAACGDENIHVLEIRVGLARCLLLQMNLAEAEKAFKDAGTLARQLLGNSHHIAVDIVSNIAMCKLNRKPDVVQGALTAIKEQVLPFYTSVYGGAHPYTAHATGRLGLFMNCLKKESGRKPVQKALKIFDEYKQFQFTQDHPWVLELGGFIKRSSQDRLSQSIEVQALAPWCMPRFEGDVNYGAPPKHFWVDLGNNAAAAWGLVHYYGQEKEPDAAPLPIFQKARQRDVSPGAAPRAGTASSTAERRPRSAARVAVTTADGSPRHGAEESDGSTAVVGTDLAAALAAEVRARQDAEDLLESEVASKRAIEDQLEAELAAHREMDDKLAAEREERLKLEAKFQESLARINELALQAGNQAPIAAGPAANAVETEGGSGPVAMQLPGAEASAAPAVAHTAASAAEEEEDFGLSAKLDALTESDKVTAADEESASAVSAPADTTPVKRANEAAAAAPAAGEGAEDEAEADLDLGTGAVAGDDGAVPAGIVPSNKVDRAAAEAKAKADLEAAAFLFTRAKTLQDEGWYRKAHPLLEECLRVRQLHLPNDEVTISTMTAVARNHCFLNEWVTAEQVIQPTLKLAEKVCKIESAVFAEALLVKSETILCKGNYVEAVKSLNKCTKLIGKILDKYPAANALLGRSVCLQALANLRSGKIPEAKAMADRGAALMSKAYGINHVAVIEAVMVKCEILLRTSKFKEATAQVEQAYTVRRRLLDDFHPAVSECLLYMGAALVGIGKLQEGQAKFTTAKSIRAEYFGEESLEYAEVLHHEAQLCARLCEFQEALRKNLEVLRIRTALLPPSHPTLSDTHHQLGVLYTTLAQFAEGDKHLSLAMGMRAPLSVAPAFHPLVAQTRCAQGELLRLQGDYDAARVMVEQSLEEHKVLFGKENADYLHVQQCFGLILRDQGELDDADKVNKRTIKYRRQVLGLDHPDLAVSLLHQIELLIDRNLHAEAQVMLTEATGIVKMHFSDCAAHTAVIQLDVSRALIDMAVFEKKRADGDVVTNTGAADSTGEAKPEEHSTTVAAGESLYKKTATAAEGEDAAPANNGNDENQANDSTIEVPPEEIHAPPAEKEAEEVADPVPRFPNEDYVRTVEALRSAVAQLQSLYQINLRNIRATASSKTPKLDSASAPPATTKSPVTGLPHPQVSYLEGCIGNTMLLEHLAKQRFAESLSPQDRELFNNHESYLRLQSKEVKTKPAGLPELEVALEALLKYPTATGTFNPEHIWAKRLKTAIGNVVFVLDDLAVAANTFIEAGQLHQKGKYGEADAKYDEVFITQLTALGAVQASSSLVVAETLFAKAENCRYLGEIELSKMLYSQSISIFRKQLGGDNEGVLKGLLGLTALLSWQGLYDDAYAMHNRILPHYINKFTEQSGHVAKLKTDIAFDLYKVGKFERAMKYAKEALYTLTHLPSAVSPAREAVVHARLVVAYIHLAVGNFPSCKDQVEAAQVVLEGEPFDPHNHPPGTVPPPATVTDDILMPLSALLECKAEYLLVHSKVYEASKTATRALKMRVKALGRTNRIAEGNKNADRKMTFFDSLDHLTVETNKGQQLDSDDEEIGAGRRHVSHVRGNKQDEADKQLDLEMQEAFASIMEVGGFSADDTAASQGGATVPSSVRFNPRSSGAKPAYLQRGVPVQSHPVLADTLYLKGRIGLTLGDFAEAKEMFDGALGMLEELFPKPSQKKLSISHELADLTFRKGGLEEARVLHTALLQQRLQLCDEDHPDKAESLFKIAQLNNLLSKYDDSTQILSEALNLRKKVYGDTHWKIAEVYAECALVLHAKGFHSDSDGLYDKAMLMARRSFGELHLLISTVYLGQAANARECGLYEQGNAYVEQAAAMRGMLLGESHALYAECLYEQALVMRCLGRILEVKRLLDTAIAVQREKLGKYHPFTAMTLLSMAVNFMDLAKYNTATHVFNRAVQLVKKSFGKDHALIAYGLTGMAENARCQGLYEEARSTHEKALYLRRKLFGDRHHTIGESTYFLGEVHLVLAKFEDATKCFDDALALQRMALGQTHAVIATTTHGLAKVMLAQGRVTDAKSIHERAYTMRKHCLAADHPDIGDSQFCNALVYQKLGKYDQAAALFERCLVTVRDSRGARHPMVATIICHCAEVANCMGRFALAVSLLLEALQIRQSVFQDVNENHPDLAATYLALGENLRLRGKYDFIEDSEKALPEVKKVFKALPKVGGAGNKGPNAPYDVSASTEGSGYDIAEAILEGNRPRTAPNSSAPATVGGTVRFDPVIDEKSAPSVMISAIEQFDPLEQGKGVVANDSLVTAPTMTESQEEALAADEYSIPQQVTDHRAMTDNPKVYKALPMFKRVLAHYSAVFPADHPLLLQTQYAIAEATRLMGKYDLALENHQDILAARRKVLGDNHPDTVLSMLAIGESLQGLGKIYPETASGSVDAKQVRVARQAMSLGVTLLDHLNSLVAPVETEGTLAPLPGTAGSSTRPGTEAERASTASGGLKKKATDAATWDFLSKPDVPAKKKEALKLPKGYMGYQFPAAKKIVRQETNTATRPKKVRTGDAKWLYDTGFAAQKRTYGENAEHPTTAALMYAKGELLRLRGDNSAALALFDASLVMRRKLYRGNHPCIADCINSMAEVFRNENKFKQALPMYDKALEIRVEAYEGAHPSVAEVKNNLAMLYFAEGRFPEAQKLFEEALAICEELLGACHPSTAGALTNLAGMLQAAGQHKLALPLYQRALGIKQQTYGEEHVEVASMLNNLGLLYKALGRYDDSQANYEKALEIQRKLHGTTHKDIATTLNNLAALYVTLNKRHEAKELYKDSVAMRSALFGVDHPTVAATLNNYAGLLFSMGELDPAKDYFEDALRIRRKVLGEDHPSVAETLNNIGLLLYTQGQIKEALPLYERALEIKRAAFGDMNPSVATSLNNLGSLYHKVGHFDHAAALYKSAYDIRKAVLGEVHDDTLAVEENLKAVKRDKHRYAALQGAKASESVTSSELYAGGQSSYSSAGRAAGQQKTAGPGQPKGRK
jgi:tetratricopeptide (TPR) repeat protein